MVKSMCGNTVWANPNPPPNPIPRIDPEFAALIPPLSPEEYNQLGRRNLTDAMRIELALSKVELLRQKAKENLRRGGRKKAGEQIPEKPSEIGAEKPFSESYKQNDESINAHKVAAREAGVSDGTLHNYLQVTKQGSPELIEDVRSGKIKIDAAHRLLEKQITKQLNQADKQIRSIVEAIPKLHEWAASDSFSQTRPDGKPWDTPPLTFDEIDFNSCQSPNDMNIDVESVNKGIMAMVAGLVEQIKELKEAYDA